MGGIGIKGGFALFVFRFIGTDDVLVFCLVHAGKPESGAFGRGCLQVEDFAGFHLDFFNLRPDMVHDLYGKFLAL